MSSPDSYRFWNLANERAETIVEAKDMIDNLLGYNHGDRIVCDSNDGIYLLEAAHRRLVEHDEKLSIVLGKNKSAVRAKDISRI